MGPKHDAYGLFYALHAKVAPTYKFSVYSRLISAIKQFRPTSIRAVRNGIVPVRPYPIFSGVTVMKKVLICSVVALVILLAGSTALTQEKGRAREGNKDRKNVAGNKISEEEKQWREKLKAMTPEERQLALAQRTFDTEMAPWQHVRKIAAEEKATKTLAAIDKIIAEKKTQFDKRLKAMKERGQPKPKAEAEKRTGENKPRDSAKPSRKKANKGG